MKRTGTALAAVILLVIGIASPAAALVSKSGTQACHAPNSNSYTVALSNGDTTIKGPGGTSAFFVGSATWVTRSRSGAYGGGGWFVNTNRSLNDPGTYAGCSGAV